MKTLVGCALALALIAEAKPSSAGQVTVKEDWGNQTVVLEGKYTGKTTIRYDENADIVIENVDENLIKAHLTGAIVKKLADWRGVKAKSARPSVAPKKRQTKKLARGSRKARRSNVHSN